MNEIQNTGATLPTRYENNHGKRHGDERPASSAGPAAPEMSISPMGRMMSGMSQMSDGEREQMREFRGQVRAAKQGGEFDAAALAGSAPDFLKTFADENGISLESVVERMGHGGPLHAPGHEGAMGGQRPGLSDYLSADADEEQDGASTLMDALFGEEEKDES